MDQLSQRKKLRKDCSHSGKGAIPPLRRKDTLAAGCVGEKCQPRHWDTQIYLEEK